MSGATQVSEARFPLAAYRALTVSGAVFQTASANLVTRVGLPRTRSDPTTPCPQRRGLDTDKVWTGPGSLAATTGLLPFPRATEMFQFTRCPPCNAGYPSRDGLPHSEIVGSMPGSGSPTLIAAVPRPSSACSAEASTGCSFCLPCWNIDGWVSASNRRKKNTDTYKDGYPSVV